jgi:hypothetical protein
MKQVKPKKTSSLKNMDLYNECDASNLPSRQNYVTCRLYIHKPLQKPFSKVQIGFVSSLNSLEIVSPLFPSNEAIGIRNHTSLFSDPFSGL